MVKFGNFIFKYRNVIFPLFFVILVFATRPVLGSVTAEKWRYTAGIAVALSGQIVRAVTIGLAYIIRGGRNRQVYAKKLVTDGIFAHSRNPLYLGNILIVIGLGIAAHSIPFYIIGIPFFLFMYAAIIRAEEHFLADKFGDEYREYCMSVNRLIPRLVGLGKTIKSMSFNWSRLIIKEYGTTYTWIICMVMLILKNQYIRYDNDIDRSVVMSLILSAVLFTVLYAVARYLKKSSRLTAD